MTPEQAAQLKPGDIVYLALIEDDDPCIRRATYAYAVERRAGGEPMIYRFDERLGGYTARRMYRTAAEAKAAVAELLRDRIDHWRRLLEEWDSARCPGCGVQYDEGEPHVEGCEAPFARSN